MCGFIGLTYNNDITGIIGEPIFAQPSFVALVEPNRAFYTWAHNTLPFFLLIGLHSKANRVYNELHGLGFVYYTAQL